MFSIYILCLSVCLFVSRKRQNDWTDRAKILCGISRGPQGRYFNDKNFKNLPQYIKFDFWTNPRIIIFMKSAKFLFVFDLQSTQRNMFTIEDGRKAP